MLQMPGNHNCYQLNIDFNLFQKLRDRKKIDLRQTSYALPKYLSVRHMLPYVYTGDCHGNVNQ